MPPPRMILSHLSSSDSMTPILEDTCGRRACAHACVWGGLGGKKGSEGGVGVGVGVGWGWGGCAGHSAQAAAAMLAFEPPTMATKGRLGLATAPSAGDGSGRVQLPVQGCGMLPSLVATPQASFRCLIFCGLSPATPCLLPIRFSSPLVQFAPQ